MGCAEALLRERHAAFTRRWPAEEWTNRKESLLSSLAGEIEDAQTVEGLVLVGREWLRGLAHPEIATLEKTAYGGDTFDPLVFSEECQSDRLWGYECPFRGSEFAADHLFPRSLGGPTDARNRLNLCRWHNTAKSMDVHVFPWEEGIPDWVPQLLRVLARWIDQAGQ